MSKSEKQIVSEAAAKALPSSFDVDRTIRELITEAVRDCKSKSRAQIAEEMSYLLGRRVSEHMLNAYSADSKDEHRFPLSFTAAFCRATGDARLLEAVAGKLGLTLIREDEERLLQLGAATVEFDRVARRVEELKALAGGAR